VRLSANGGIPPAGGCGKLAKPMGLRTYTPPPPLDRFVDVLWLYKGYQPAHAHSKERLMPDGSVALVINLRDDVTRIYDRNHLEKCHTMPGAILCGVHTECFVIDTKEQADVVGVQFRPGGAFPFLGLPPGETHNLHVPLDALWGSLAKEVRERLLGARSETETFQILESMLLARARGAFDRHPAVAFALKEFQGTAHARAVGEVTEQTGLSARRFIDVFEKEVGLTPKLFCRVRRFQKVLRLIRSGREIDWTEIALSCGYYDQAHFIHDFRAFSGVNPSTYVASFTPHMNHVPILSS
jgi:AraC-like DNA-binding protein